MSNNVMQELPLTAFGDMRVAELTPQMQGSFEYTVDNTELNTNTVTNGGTVTQSNGMCVVGTSTTTASTAKFRTERHAKYRVGLGGLARFTTLFETNVASTEQYVGIMDEQGSGAAFKNGLAVGYDGTTFGFHRFQNDTKITVAQTDFNRDKLDGTGPSGMTLDPTKLNVWAIRCQYLGAGEIQLLCEDDSTGELIVVHETVYTNANTQPSTFNPNYHFIIWADNKATTTDLVVKSSSYAYFVEGKTKYYETHQPQQSSGTVQKTSVTTATAILTIRSKSTYASKTNFIDSVLELFTASIEAGGANNLATIRLIKDATLGGTPSWSDINTTNSVMEIDTSGTTVTGGKELLSIPLAGKNDKAVIDVTPYDILLRDGETITISGSSANSATIRGSLLWKELF